MSDSSSFSQEYWAFSKFAGPQFWQVNRWRTSGDFAAISGLVRASAPKMRFGLSGSADPAYMPSWRGADTAANESGGSSGVAYLRPECGASGVKVTKNGSPASAADEIDDTTSLPSTSVW